MRSSLNIQNYHVIRVHIYSTQIISFSIRVIYVIRVPKARISIGHRYTRINTVHICQKVPLADLARKDAVKNTFCHPKFHFRKILIQLVQFISYHT